MGNKQFKLTKLALALGVSVSLAGCFSDNDNNVDIKPPPEPTQKVVAPPTDQVVEKQAGSFSIVVTDSLGNALADDVTASITFPGNPATVLNTAGEALGEDDTTSAAGSFAFTVAEIPEAGLTFDFVVTANGFLSNSGTVELTADDADVAELIRLTPRTLTQEAGKAPIIATTSALTDLKDADGNDVTVTYTAGTGLSLGGAGSIELNKKLDSTINAGKAAGGVKVKLKEGTKFVAKNADGEDVELDELPTLTVAYFGNEATGFAANNGTADDNANAAADSALDAFPGGLALTVAAPESEDAANVSGSFTTGGFVAIELVDSQNRKVKNFGKNADNQDNTLEVAMQVDAKTVNPCPITLPEGGDLAAEAAKAFDKGVCTVAAPVARPLAAEDIFPVWSYDEDAGKWTFESYGVVKANGTDDTFDVVVEVNHLSYWNLDFFTYIIGADKCPNRRFSFDIVDSAGNPSQQYADVLVEASGYRLLIGAYNRTNLAKGTFRNPPSFPVKLKMMKDGKNILDSAMDKDGNLLGGAATDGQASAVNFPNLCSLDGGKLTLTTAPAAPIAKNLTPQFTCSNNDAGDVPATPVSTPTIAQLFRNDRFVKTFYPSGTFSVNLEQAVAGANVTYKVRYKNPRNNTWFTKDIGLNATAETLDIPVTCTINEVPVTGTGGN
ncbi:hypothetical protein C3B51_05990 [Pseudoalteromonas rubra]|uniref:Big-1 domain-containing protein n=1 Tax=Pseudoalteromonas rubra TaxID=43658 RepID=A0A4Q7EKG1_9GAMM|nr:hypothetical protein [Pseudoalteromonas rubra]RZM83682.1 hypothetical protein C3B51_05990 [Pseudoalteromonas rubra]